MELTPEQAHAAEGGEEGDAGDHWREHERELQDRRDHVATWERRVPSRCATGVPTTTMKASGDEARLDADPQRVARDRRLQLVDQRRERHAQEDCQQRQPDEDDEDGGGDRR